MSLGFNGIDQAVNDAAARSIGSGMTYAVAAVAGFGWLLLAMGVSLCGPGDRWLRRSYVAVWLMVLLYSEVPWAGLLLEWMG